MPDEPRKPTGPPAAPAPAAKPAPAPPPTAGHVPMTEEFDRAKWTLPPAAPVLLALVVLALIVAGYAYFGRAKPWSAGQVTETFAVEQSDQRNVLVEVHVQLRNVGEKTMRVHLVRAELTVPGESEPLKDEAASAVDYERYFQAYPELKQHAIAPLAVGTSVAPGAQQEGMAVFGFPVSRDAFERRQQLRIIVEFEDRPSLVLPPRS